MLRATNISLQEPKIIGIKIHSDSVLGWGLKTRGIRWKEWTEGSTHAWLIFPRLENQIQVLKE